MKPSCLVMRNAANIILESLYISIIPISTLWSRSSWMFFCVHQGLEIYGDAPVLCPIWGQGLRQHRNRDQMQKMNLQNLTKEKIEYTLEVSTSTDPHICDVIKEQNCEIETAIAWSIDKLATLDNWK